MWLVPSVAGALSLACQPPPASQQWVTIVTSDSTSSSPCRLIETARPTAFNDARLPAYLLLDRYATRHLARHITSSLSARRASSTTTHEVLVHEAKGRPARAQSSLITGRPDRDGRTHAQATPNGRPEPHAATNKPRHHVFSCELDSQLACALGRQRGTFAVIVPKETNDELALGRWRARVPTAQH